ncbi:unnamed protein product [Ilex paraguariensis]|uniref:Transmembrane protein 45B n=1 Tax=Ilex paraguariensis TaxID=185542 RepID=A0ABC8S0R2_9AQUA
MGTFMGHIVPGLAIALLGIWHTINTIKSYYLKGSFKFTSRFWYPFKSPLLMFKHLELILVLSFSITAIFLQVLDFPFLHFSFKLDNFEHATVFLHVAIFACFTLFTELTLSSEILTSVSGILASSVLGQELFLLHYHSADHVGLEGHYHWLLQLIVCVSLMAALSMTCFPTCFPAALVLSISVVFQGCWFMNMGFMLWVPEFVPQGCVGQLGNASGSNVHSAVMCETLEAGSRARALANLQFSWILSGIMALMGCICFVLPRKVPPREQTTEYEQLHCRVADVPIAITGFKQAHP